MLSVVEFAKALQVHRRNQATAGLVIGLDGTSALLGHAAPERLIQEIYGDRPVPGRRQTMELKVYWERLDRMQQEGILKKNLAEVAADTAAVSVLAELLRQGYVQVIMASDPNRQLFERLQGLNVEIAWFSCGLSRSGVLRSYGQTLLRQRVFVDGAELLISGLSLIHEDDPEKVKLALKEFSSKLTCSYVWGWGQHNVEFTKVWGPSRSVYALGEHSDCLDLEDYEVVTDGVDPSRATVDFWLQIGKLLFPDLCGSPLPRVRRQSGETSPITTIPAAISELALAPCLLWSDEDVGSLVAGSLEARISLVAVEGGVVRSRIASRVLARLRQDGRACWLSSVGSESLADLLLLTMNDVDNQSAVLIVHGNGYSNSAAFRDILVVELDRWLARHEGTESHLLLFCPRDLLEAVQGWANREERRPGGGEGVKQQLFRPDGCMASAALERWLRRLPELKALENPAGSAERPLAVLAESLLSSLPKRFRNPCAENADLLHQALDAWYRALGRWFVERSEDETGDSFPAADLLALWEALFSEVPREGPLALLDFEMDAPRRRKREEIGDLHIRPRQGQASNTSGGSDE